MCVVLFQHLPSTHVGLLLRPLLLCLVLALTESEHVGTALEGDAMERLSQSVGSLVVGGSMLQLDSVALMWSRVKKCCTSMCLLRSLNLLISAMSPADRPSMYARL